MYDLIKPKFHLVRCNSNNCQKEEMIDDFLQKAKIEIVFKESTVGSKAESYWKQTDLRINFFPLLKTE